MIRNKGTMITKESAIVLARYSGTPKECVMFDVVLAMKSVADIIATMPTTSKVISNTTISLSHLCFYKEVNLIKRYSLKLSMRFSDIVRFYSDDKVKDKIIASAKQREVVARFNDKVGARPDVLVYGADIADLVKKGATSFHASLERWTNPMLLKDMNTKKDLDTIRSGWDLQYSSR